MKNYLQKNWTHTRVNFKVPHSFPLRIFMQGSVSFGNATVPDPPRVMFACVKQYVRHAHERVQRLLKNLSFPAWLRPGVTDSVPMGSAGLGWAGPAAGPYGPTPTGADLLMPYEPLSCGVRHTSKERR